MKIEVVTLFPRMIAAALEFGIVGRAIGRGLLSVGTEDPRAHATDVHRTSLEAASAGVYGEPSVIDMPRALTRFAGVSVASTHPESISEMRSQRSASFMKWVEMKMVTP